MESTNGNLPNKHGTFFRTHDIKTHEECTKNVNNTIEINHKIVNLDYHKNIENAGPGYFGRFHI